MCLHLCSQVLDSSLLKYEDHRELYLVKLITEAMVDTWSALCLVCLVCTPSSSGLIAPNSVVVRLSCGQFSWDRVALVLLRKFSLLPPANEVWGKVIFSQASVILLMGEGSAREIPPLPGRPPCQGDPLPTRETPCQGDPPTRETTPHQGDHPPPGRPPARETPLPARRAPCQGDPPPPGRPPAPCQGDPPAKETPLQAHTQGGN